MIMFLGLPGEKHEDREAFQEIETKQLFSSFVKWAAVIRSTARIPEYVSHAFHAAKNGRPGPVVLGLPEDMLSSVGEAADGKAARFATPAPSDRDIEELKAALAKAKRPVMIVGGPGWNRDVQRSVEAFAERYDMPVAAPSASRTTWTTATRTMSVTRVLARCRVAGAIKGADVLIVVGARLGEMTTSTHTLIDIRNPSQFLVHVHPSGNELARSIARSADQCDGATFARVLDGSATGRDAVERTEEGAARELRAVAEANCDTRRGAIRGGRAHGIGHDAGKRVITNGAGNYAGFVHKYTQ